MAHAAEENLEAVDGGCFGKYKKRKDNHAFSERTEASVDDNEITAEAPVSVLDDYYKMDHPYRGLLIIFNHEKFDPATKQPLRAGTNVDVEKIKKAFESIGFEVHIYTDRTLKEIQGYVKKYVKYDYYHKKRDCLAIFILTHGDKDILWARDTSYDPAEEIWSKFTSEKCPSLAGKPKLIFIQACQGKKLDKGIKLKFSNTKKRTEFDGSYYYRYPVNADFLIFYATCEGHYAFRNNVTGSFWVTLLCEELQKRHESQDIQTILTFVNRRLAVEFSSSNSADESKSGMKQVSYFKSSLTRLLIFRRKN